MTKYTDEKSNFGADMVLSSPHHPRRAGRSLRMVRTTSTLLAEDVVFEYVISVPGYPRRVEGRQNIIDLYSNYDNYMTVRTVDNLRVYLGIWKHQWSSLEYEVHGESVQTGRPYNNHFVSVITIEDEKVTHWRDYLDPIAVFDAAGWPDTPA